MSMSAQGTDVDQRPFEPSSSAEPTRPGKIFRTSPYRSPLRLWQAGAQQRFNLRVGLGAGCRPTRIILSSNSNLSGDRVGFEFGSPAAPTDAAFLTSIPSRARRDRIGRRILASARLCLIWIKAWRANLPSFSAAERETCHNHLPPARSAECEDGLGFARGDPLDPQS